jgi:hypothetical protein
MTCKTAEQQALVDVLYSLDAQAEKIGWDQPPNLLFLLGNIEGAGCITAPIERVLDLFDGDPLALLASVAHRMTIMPCPSAFSDALWAVVWICESYGIIGSADELEMIIANRTVHDHPDRIEFRMVVAADRDGTSYVLMHERDSVVLEGVAGIGESDFGGIVVQHVESIAAALTGRA